MPKKQYGFTLIEILVSVSIIGVLVGSGIAAYRRFNDKQQVLSSAKEFEQIIRSTQKKAKSGEKPEIGCSRLSGYRVTSTINLSTVDVFVLCDGSAPILDKQHSLNGTIFRESFSMDFLVLSGGVNGAQTVTLGDTNNLYNYVVEVTTTGAVRSVGFNE